MAYRQITKCIKPELFVDLGANFNGWRRIGFTGLFEFMVLVPLAFVGALPVLIALVYQIIIFLTWWLYGRLICLGNGEDKCIIGALGGKNPPAPEKKGGDDDTTMNIFLAGGPLTKTLNEEFREKEVFWNSPLGIYVTPQESVTNIGRGYANDNDHYTYSAALHCEFEGDGLYNLLQWAQAILLLLLVAMAVPPPFNYIVLALAFLITLFAGLNNFLDLGPIDYGNEGSYLDVNPNLAVVEEGDILFIRGRWIYDSLHDGWNEFHAVHACYIIGKLTVDFVPERKKLEDILKDKNLDRINALAALSMDEIWGTVEGCPPLNGANLDNGAKPPKMRMLQKKVAVETTQKTIGKYIQVLMGVKNQLTSISNLIF
jgi:hypothetical protein